ncbi:hypothetical protein NL676_022193 [Syzygium grande]|nr:hypothetical protein NL676_022193 [Syzygium grande]
MQAEQFYGGDRRFDDALFAVPKGKRTMEAEQVVVNSGDPGREMWLDEQEEEEENLLNVNEAASVFYSDFPLPDFPCMSSSSSSSSTRAPVKATTYSSSSSSSASSSSSSAASWAALKSEDTTTDNIENRKNSRRSGDCDNNSNRFFQHAGEADAPSQALSSTASMEIILEPHVDQASTDAVGSFIDAMDTFGYMDLLESNDFFDPASLFQSENLLEEEFPNKEPEAKLAEQQNYLAQATAAEADSATRTGPVSDEMGAVLLEWLTENKDNISAEDLRRIKIKKATVETAAKRLGGGRDAMKQLLKLILQWVQTNHLHKKRLKESAPVSASQVPYQDQEPFHHHQNPNPNLSSSPEPNGLHSPSFPHQPQWISPPPPYVVCPAPMMEVPPPQPGYGPAPGYMGDPVYCHGAPPDHLSGNAFPPEYHMINSAQSWPMSQFSLASQPYDYPENFHQPPQAHGLRGYQHQQYPFQYYNGNDQRLVRLGSSATKEARKKRMARQRRFCYHRSSHHHHQSNQQGNHQSNQQEAAHPAHNHPGSWVYWPSPANAGPVAAPPPLLVVDPMQVAHPADRPAMQPQNYQRQVAPERRQGWKSENNLKFLLQKVLKQSDVGNLGRIVLPKKEAETHLPELEARDGISIPMEDIGTSKVWNMRYRFWPNNKSRMYLLENTGDFVRANGLEEGDFIVIYSDVKCGKYMIRGVKVRQPEGTKLEAHKRPEKPQRNMPACSSQEK